MEDTDKHLSPEEAQHAIYDTRYRAVKMMVDFIDSHLAALDRNHQAAPQTEMQTIAYYCARNAALTFKDELQKHQHEYYKEYQFALNNLRLKGVVRP